ncbi:MAG: hypothetical protein WDN49_06710 [Acetobacteraceae bacterium]
MVLKNRQDRRRRAGRAIHTASLAGSYEAFAALCRAHGAILGRRPR